MGQVTTSTVVGADAFSALAFDMAREAELKTLGAMQDIATKWEYEAKLRIPVETGNARNQTFGHSGVDGEGVYAKVENNTEYASFLEFGTKHIAGGAVLALGDREDVTDAEAVHSWAAKDGNANDRTSHSHRGGKLNNGKGDVLASQRPQEEMPWLRTSFMAIREWAIRRIAKAFN